MAPHSSTLAWKIPWTEEPGRLQSMGSQRVGHDCATSLSLFTFMHWRRKWQPTPVFLPGESQGWEAWWASVYGVAQSRTRLKQLSSSSSKVSPKLPPDSLSSKFLLASPPGAFSALLHFHWIAHHAPNILCFQPPLCTSCREDVRLHKWKHRHIIGT